MVHKIHGSVRYDTVVSRFGTFSIRGSRTIGLRHNAGNIYILNMKASQWLSHKHAFAPGFAAHVQTLGKIYAGEHLNLS